MKTRGYFGSALRTETLKDGNNVREVVLLDPFSYYSGHLGEWVKVPAGFTTDFASIPRAPFATWLLAGVGDRAAVIHDYLCRSKDVSRPDADAVFREALAASGVASWRRFLFYAGVRTWTALKPVAQ